MLTKHQEDFKMIVITNTQKNTYVGIRNSSVDTAVGLYLDSTPLEMKDGNFAVSEVILTDSRYNTLKTNLDAVSFFVGTITREVAESEYK